MYQKGYYSYNTKSNKQNNKLGSLLMFVCSLSSLIERMIASCAECISRETKFERNGRIEPQIANKYLLYISMKISIRYLMYYKFCLTQETNITDKPK